MQAGSREHGSRGRTAKAQDRTEPSPTTANKGCQWMAHTSKDEPIGTATRNAHKVGHMPPRARKGSRGRTHRKTQENVLVEAKQAARLAREA